MQKIKIFGIASNSFSKYSTCSFAISNENGNYGILVDCGPDTPKQIYNKGISFFEIKTVIITHSHFDHTLGLPYFLFGRNLEILSKRKGGIEPEEDIKKLDIISSKEIFETIIMLLKVFHPEVKIQYEINHIDISENLENGVAIQESQFVFFEVNHAVKTYGFKMQGKRKSFAYSCDTLPSDILIKKCRNVDVLIYECMMPDSEEIMSRNTKHSTPIHAIDMISRINPKKAYLFHIQPLFSNRMKEFELQVTEATKISTSYPKEGSTIKL